MVALGRLVMSTRERICAIEVEESGMLITTLRTAEEVRDVGQVPDVTLPKAEPQMLAIAEKIVDQQAGKFEPAEFVERYGDALRELIEEKKKGHVVATPAPAKAESNVIDLMAALKKSLKTEEGEGRLPPNHAMHRCGAIPQNAPAAEEARRLSLVPIVAWKATGGPAVAS